MPTGTAHRQASPASPDTPSAHFGTAKRKDRSSASREVPDALLRSPPDAPVLVQAPPHPLELPTVAQPHPARAPVPESPACSSRDPACLLSDTSGINADEEYSHDEQLLNEFTKMHPMLS